MKRTMTAIGFFMVSVLFVAGCASDPILGTVRTSDGLALGSAAPDIHFTTTKGEQTSLRKVNQDLTIIAFSTPGKEGCGKLKPQLVALYEQLGELPITVVQVAVPTLQCPHGPSSIQVAGLGSDFIVLCDDETTAWKAYGEPTPNTAFLIGENSRVKSIASLDELSPLEAKARRLGREIVARHAGD
jgi:peroxiredoxin